MTEFQDSIFGMIPNRLLKSKVNEKTSNNDDFEEFEHSLRSERQKSSRGKKESRYDEKTKSVKFRFAGSNRYNREYIDLEKKYRKDSLTKERRKTKKKNRFESTPKNFYFQESEAENFNFEIVLQEIWDELEEKIDARSDEIYHEMLCNGEKFCPCGHNFPRELAEREILKIY